MKRINPLGFLGFVGLVGIVSFFSESNATAGYFGYALYFAYFFQPFTPKLRESALKSLGIAYLITFLVNLILIVMSNFESPVDYRANFYTSYMAGSFTFPIAFALLKLSEFLRRRKGLSR